MIDVEKEIYRGCGIGTERGMRERRRGEQIRLGAELTSVSKYIRKDYKSRWWYHKG